MTTYETISLPLFLSILALGATIGWGATYIYMDYQRYKAINQLADHFLCRLYRHGR